MTTNILWRNSIRKGFWHPHTVEIQQLTNQNVELMDEDRNPTTRIPWSQISNVVVLNSHNVGMSDYYGFGVGHYMRSYGEVSFHNSNNIGDVAFLDKSGAVRVMFKQIMDPMGVKQLATSQMKK